MLVVSQNLICDLGWSYGAGRLFQQCPRFPISEGEIEAGTVTVYYPYAASVQFYDLFYYGQTDPVFGSRATFIEGLENGLNFFAGYTGTIVTYFVPVSTGVVCDTRTDNNPWLVRIVMHECVPDKVIENLVDLQCVALDNPQVPLNLHM